jgi:hypothetical protein
MFNISQILRSTGESMFKDKFKTNYRMKDGDAVELLNPARVDGYWYEPKHMASGSWDNHFMLTGCRGIVVKARTPCVVSPDGRTRYFANVDIEHHGVKSRVRVYHSELKRLPAPSA